MNVYLYYINEKYLLVKAKDILTADIVCKNNSINPLHATNASVIIQERIWIKENRLFETALKNLNGSSLIDDFGNIVIFSRYKLIQVPLDKNIRIDTVN